MAKLYGETIPEYVAKQIRVREEVLGRKGNRTTEDLRVLSQKSGWVRMISGVDLDNGSEYDPSFAKNLILAGGSMRWTGEKFEFRNEKPNFSTSASSKYYLTENLGVRPESGITSFDLKFKNRFGVIREANLSFTIWSREELNLAQDLFMRPGGQVIIEWGNSLYLNNKGEVQDSSFDYTTIEEYFKKISVEQMYEYMEQNKIRTDGNIDGFLGLVTNFNWKIREDGGYDCSIKSVSRGALLESLTVVNSLDSTLITESVLKEIEKKSDDVEELANASSSLLHYFIYLVNKTDRPNDREVINVNDIDSIRLNWKAFFTGETPTNFSEIVRELSGKVIRKVNGITQKEDNLPIVTSILRDNKDRACKYISLRTLLFLVENSLSLLESSDLSLPKFYLGYLKENQSNIDPPTYRTFPLHFSIDPFTAILPKFHPGPEEVKKVINEKYFPQIYYPGPIRVGTQRIPVPYPFHLYDGIDITGNLREVIPDTDYEDILNIFINLNVVEDILRENISKNEDGSIGFKGLEFIKNILDKINIALGGINSLDIHFDEERQLHFIVDREIIAKKATEDRDIVTLSESGLSSTVTQLNIESKISSQLSSMIAISAQADDIRNTKADVAFIDWTKGGKNRFHLPSSPRTSTNRESNLSCEEKLRQRGINRYNYVGPNDYRIESTNYKEELQKCLKERERAENPITFFYIDLSKAYQTIYLKPKESDTIDEKFRRVRGRANRIYKQLLYGKQVINNEKEVGATGIIPIELSMEIDGISGLKIGQIFRLGNLNNPSILTPAKYDDYGFIIVGLDSKIGPENKWTTNVRAQTFKIGDLD